MDSIHFRRFGISFFAGLAALVVLGTATSSFAASYAEWCREKVSTPTAAPLLDEDGDGVETLWEYYLSRNPAVKDGPLPAANAITRSTGTAVLTASLPVPVAGTDAVVKWEVSSDLKTWTTVATSTQGGAFSGAGYQGIANGMALFRDPAPPLNGAPRFSRWTITAASSGVATLGAAPVVNVIRDDRVATLEMDHDPANWWGQQFWTAGSNGRGDVGFRVRWWPDGASGRAMVSMGGCGGCGVCGHPSDPALIARQLVTPSRRVQLQPLANGGRYHVCVERVNGLGEVTSQPTELTFDGGDSARVDALRATLTHFDDFNLPEGPADERLWNNAVSTSTDLRFRQFFINAQYHAHTLNGTQTDGPHVGDKSQVSQRFRKPILIENGVRRRIVFDMDSPMGPRSVWYLDLNPVSVDLTAHADFFDEEGAKGLPAGVVRLRSQGQTFSVHLIGDDGASHKVATVQMDEAGVVSIPNVRRAFDVRLGTDGIEVFIDGNRVINQSFGGAVVRPGAYELLWSTIGYNSSKDNNPYFLVHWDNFGFDGPVVEPRVVHNYVTRIAGEDYQRSSRWDNSFPTFTIRIPDDVRPVTAGASAEAWLVCVYQMGDFSAHEVRPTDYVLVNGARHALPSSPNNSSPLDNSLVSGGSPATIRIKLGDIVQGGSSPLIVGDNTLRFFGESVGISNVHVEIFYPPGSEPVYTPPALIHDFPMHADLPLLGPPARFESIAGTEINAGNAAIETPETILTISAVTKVAVIAGGDTWAGWAPELVMSPARSTELWSSGGTAGIKTVALYLRPKGGAPETAQRIAVVTTQRDAPAPVARHTFDIDTRRFPNGDYEIFVQAISSAGVKSHPFYDNAAARWDASAWSGAYYPVNVRIAN